MANTKGSNDPLPIGTIHLSVSGQKVAIKLSVSSSQTSSVSPHEGISREDWPPVSFADNDHILVWWLPEYDDILRELVDKWQWAYKYQIHDQLISEIPEDVLEAWRESDPVSKEYAWYNVLWNFAQARAKKLGLTPDPPQRKTCLICSRTFTESDLSPSFLTRLGIGGLDFCQRCLIQALFQNGSSQSTREDVISVLQVLAEALGHPLRAGELEGRISFEAIPRDSRIAVIQALRVRPSAARVKELFGSLPAAIEAAAAAPATPLPPYDPSTPRPPSRPRGVASNDPATYLPFVWPLPEVRIDPTREPFTYHQEIGAIIGTGYLALAEAALLQLGERDHPFLEPLARVYGETARFDEARAAIDKLNGQLLPNEQPRSVNHLLAPRDLRTLTTGPAFYVPLKTLPRAKVRFVFVGGEMDYVDRRGKHHCVSGDVPAGGASHQFSESISRMNAMVESSPWLEAAVRLANSIRASHARLAPEARPYSHLVTYATGSFRELVKSITGAPPKKIGEDDWRIEDPGRSRWAYQRDSGQFIFNAVADFRYMIVEAPPAVCVWAWPDRSDLCLQAYLDTFAYDRKEPLTLVLPDVPDLRDFARRYVRQESMTKVVRGMLEDYLYHSPVMLPNKRGLVLASTFAPTLIVHPDGREEDGALIEGALAYLDAHHTLKLSAWDLLQDELLRATAASVPLPVKVFSLKPSERDDMLRWYAELPEYDDPAVLFQPYRPTLLSNLKPS